MKKSKLIVGILLMILGIGVSFGSVVLHHYEYSRYGMISPKHRIMNNRGVWPGNGSRGYQQRPSIAPEKPFNAQPNPKQRKAPAPNRQPNQNPNRGQSANGGVNQ